MVKLDCNKYRVIVTKFLRKSVKVYLLSPLLLLIKMQMLGAYLSFHCAVQKLKTVIFHRIGFFQPKKSVGRKVLTNFLRKKYGNSMDFV